MWQVSFDLPIWSWMICLAKPEMVIVISCRAEEELRVISEANLAYSDVTAERFGIALRAAFDYLRKYPNASPLYLLTDGLTATGITQ
jgi:hypothetical protein